MTRPVCRKRGQRVHVRRHPGHDLAGQLALVVVEAEPLELREDLDPQGVEDPLAGAAGHPGLAPICAAHWASTHSQGERGGRPDARPVRPLARPRRCRAGSGPAAAARPGVDGDQGEGSRRAGRRSRAAAGAGRRSSSAARGARPRRRPGASVGRRQRGDLGEQFGGRGHPGHGGADPGAGRGGGAGHRAGRPSSAPARGDPQLGGDRVPGAACVAGSASVRLGASYGRRPAGPVGRPLQVAAEAPASVARRVALDAARARPGRSAAGGTGRERPASSSWVPMSTSRPPSRTAIRSASARVERRWAMSRVVRPAMTPRSASWISCSTRASTAEVASSRSSSRGSVRMARASATRWRWPPERVRPCSPTVVS